MRDRTLLRKVNKIKKLPLFILRTDESEGMNRRLVKRYVKFCVSSEY